MAPLKPGTKQRCHGQPVKDGIIIHSLPQILAHLEKTCPGEGRVTAQADKLLLHLFWDFPLLSQPVQRPGWVSTRSLLWLVSK